MTAPFSRLTQSIDRLLGTQLVAGRQRAARSRSARRRASTRRRRCCRRRPRPRVRPLIGPCCSSNVMMSAIDLAGMAFVGQPVDDRHGGVLGQLEQGLVLVGADHDGVDVARQHARRVGDGLAAAELQVGVVERHASGRRAGAWRRRTTRACASTASRRSCTSTAFCDAVGLELGRHALAGALHGVRHVDDARAASWRRARRDRGNAWAADDCRAMALGG